MLRVKVVIKSPIHPTRPTFILYWEETAAARNTNHPVSEKSIVLEGGDVACLYSAVFFYFLTFLLVKTKARR